MSENQRFNRHLKHGDNLRAYTVIMTAETMEDSVFYH